MSVDVICYFVYIVLILFCTVVLYDMLDTLVQASIMEVLIVTILLESHYYTLSLNVYERFKTNMNN